MIRKNKFKLFGVLAILVVVGISYILTVRYPEYKAEKDKKAENIAKYNHWKNLKDISEKAASLNKKIGNLGDI